MVICGHSHMQFDRMIGKIRVVNADSVGMPFGDSGAYWLLLGPTVQLRQTPYDLAKAAERAPAGGSSDVFGVEQINSGRGGANPFAQLL